jgi:hypothetical protein
MREIIIRNGMVFFREGCWGEMFWLFFEGEKLFPVGKLFFCASSENNSASYEWEECEHWAEVELPKHLTNFPCKLCLGYLSVCSSIISNYTFIKARKHLLVRLMMSFKFSYPLFHYRFEEQDL